MLTRNVATKRYRYTRGVLGIMTLPLTLPLALLAMVGEHCDKALGWSMQRVSFLAYVIWFRTSLKRGGRR